MALTEALVSTGSQDWSADFDFYAAASQSQHVKVYQGHGKAGEHPEASYLPVGSLLRGDDSCVTRDDALVLKEVPGLGPSLDCASAPRRSLHPPSLHRTLRP